MLALDLKRSLPTGDYRIRSELYVDGRRTPPLTKEIRFEGDPNIADIAYDTTLELNPPFLELDVVPGATRTNVLEIVNPSDQSINVTMAALMPDTLEGVVMGNLLGSELSADTWTQIAPASFTLPPRARRNVRVITRVPRDSVDHRYYYADLMLEGTYADGRSAGQTRSGLMLLQANVPPAPSGVLERLSVAEAEGVSRYFVQTRFVNTGNVHLEPTLEARLLSEEGGIVATQRLDGQTGILLPLGVRDFGGELDLAGLAAGAYVLEARTEVGGDIVTRRTPVEIIADGEARRLTILQE